MADGPPRILQIEDVLKQRYFLIVTPLNRPTGTSEQHEQNRLSRSLAALAIEKLADVPPALAAGTIVDDFNDNGIDAVFFDRLQNQLLLIQAKFKHGGNTPDSGENKKFCDGVRDLIGRRFHRFNKHFERLQPEIEEALETERLKIVGCHVHLGGQLGSHLIQDLDQLASELNRFSPRFEWRNLGLADVHSWLSSEHTVSPIIVTLTLDKWYGISQPHKAFYGQVSASQLATLYQQYGKALFEKNIRYYLGSQGVNQAIAHTVREHPEELFYLNNGLTAVCRQINPMPGAGNDQGRFIVHGFSIVNGAQTVGSIAAVANTAGTDIDDAKVLITLIEIGTTSDSLGSRITQSRNYQNFVHGLHFAALDPNQERLRRELAISEVTYHYRPSLEATLQDPQSIRIENAVLALACLSGTTEFAIAAKREVSQLHDRNGPIYPKLFTDNLTGVRVCRAVRIYEYLDGILASSECSENSNSRRMFFRHGRYFVMHILARRYRALLDKSELSISDEDKLQLSRVLLELAELAYTEAETMFSGNKGYLAVFRNMTDSQPLAQRVMQCLAERDAEQAAARRGNQSLSLDS